MARAIAEDVFKKAGIPAAFSSAGIYAHCPSPASVNAAGSAAANGLSLTGHISRPVTEETLKTADLALTMTISHKTRLMELYPQYGKKIFTIHEYVTGSGADVADPYGQDAGAYDFCFQTLKKLIVQLAEKLNTDGRGDMV